MRIRCVRPSEVGTHVRPSKVCTMVRRQGLYAESGPVHRRGGVRRGPYAEVRTQIFAGSSVVRGKVDGVCTQRSVRRGLYAEVRTRVRTQTFSGPLAVRGEVDGVSTQVRTQNS